MNRVRKFVSIVLAFTLVICFASCNGKTPKPGAGEDPKKIVAGEYLLYKVIDEGKSELLFSDLEDEMDIDAIKKIAKMCNVTLDKSGKGTMSVLSGGTVDVSFDETTGKVTMNGGSDEQVSDYKFEGDELHLIEENTIMCFLREDSKEWSNIKNKN